MTDANDAGALVERFANYADKAGKPEVFIRCAVNRKTLMNSTAYKCGRIRAPVRGGPLYIDGHRIYCADEREQPPREAQA